MDNRSLSKWHCLLQSKQCRFDIDKCEISDSTQCLSLLMHRPTCSSTLSAEWRLAVNNRETWSKLLKESLSRHTVSQRLKLPCNWHVSVFCSIYLKHVGPNNKPSVEISFDLGMGRVQKKALMWLQSPPKPHPPIKYVSCQHAHFFVLVCDVQGCTIIQHFLSSHQTANVTIHLL